MTTPDARWKPAVDVVYGYLSKGATAHPSDTLLSEQGRSLSWIDTLTEVDRLAAALVTAGVVAGDRVACLAEPSIDFFVNFLATASIGAIWVGLNPKYRVDELDYVIGDATPMILMSVLDTEDANSVLNDLRERHHGLYREASTHPTNGIESMTSLIASGESIGREALDDRRAAVNPAEPVLIVYTSGSTGKPKGALLSNYGLCHMGEIAVERKGLKLRSTICNLPVNHVGSLSDICIRTLIGEGSLYFQKQFSPSAMMDIIETEQIQVWPGVPTIFQLCANDPSFSARDLSSIELIAWGGAGMPQELLRTIQRATGAAECTMGYGSTETIGGVTYSGLTDSVELLTTTIGLPDDRVPSRIWVEGDQREAKENEAGEIQVFGDWTMNGYWNRPDATTAAFTGDGWMHTGDLAVRRNDGYIQIVGRMSEMFKSGGYNVYPREVELCLETAPGVGMAAVVSIPDATFQEVGVAYVTPSDSSGQIDAVILSEDGLRAHAKKHLANYKIPKQIIVIAEMPMLPIGKVDKIALTQRSLDESA